MSASTTTARPSPRPLSDGQPLRHRGQYSVYGVADQMLWRQQDDPNRSVSAFTRVMGSPQADRNFLSFSANVGLTYHDPVANRPDDTLAIGLGYAKVSHVVTDADRDAAAVAQAADPTIYGPARHDETFIEATYQYQLRPWWQIQPDFQYVFTPGGGVADPNQPMTRVKKRSRLSECGPMSCSDPRTPSSAHPGECRDPDRRAARRLTGDGRTMDSPMTSRLSIWVPAFAGMGGWRRLLVGLGGAFTLAATAHAAPKGYLETIHRHSTLTSSVTDNGDLNPYAIVVAPVSAGKVQKDDVLVDNFNNLSNLQGTGTTIVLYRPSTKQTILFAKLSHKMAQCPGGVGLTTSMAMLKTGWVIVGSTPSKDGTTATKGDGCLIVFNPQRQARAGLVRRSHHRSLGQHGGEGRRRDRHPVHQHGRGGPPGPNRARPEDQAAGRGEEGQRAARQTDHPRWQAARDRRGDGGRRRLRPARRPGQLPARSDRRGAGRRTARSTSPTAWTT